MVPQCCRATLRPFEIVCGREGLVCISQINTPTNGVLSRAVSWDVGARGFNGIDQKEGK